MLSVDSLPHTIMYTYLLVPHPAVEGEASEAETLGHTSPRSVSPHCMAHTPSPHPTEGRGRGEEGRGSEKLVK